MQQFSSNPATFNRFNIYKGIFTHIYKGMPFTLRKNKNQRKFLICLRVNDTFNVRGNN